MKHIGVWLPQPVFGHGQLYVAVSRVGNPDNCTIAMKPEKDQAANSTKNVVFKEVLLGCVAAAQLPSWAQPTLTEPQPPLLVEDIGPEWLDYDGLDDDTDDGTFQEEFGPPCQRHIPQPAVTRPRQSRSVAETASPPPSVDLNGMRPQEWGEVSEYEVLRQTNIQQCRECWYEVFGVEFPNVD